MKFHEAMKKIQRGGKVRRNNWINGCYLHLNEDNEIVDEQNRAYYFTNITDDWEEIIEDDREEVMQVYKDLYRVVNEAYNVHIYDDIILKFITQNDYRYMIDELKVLLDMMNNVYKLDK